MKKTYILTLLLALVSISGIGQIFEPVQWSFSSKDLGNNEYELIFKAEIDEPWHLYSQKIEMQPPATLFTFEENANVEFMGIVEESESIEIFDPNFEIMTRYFSHEANFTQKIKIAENALVNVKGSIEFMSCDDAQCLPPTDIEFEFKDLGNGTANTTNVQTPDDAIESNNSDPQDNSLWVFFFIALMSG
ncbi:MAG: hypothetical protein K9J13_09775, partial [Saprospiraceae bacterium]|nr:hypothetical protein [Saprospiraceae bacterium]